MLAMCAEVYGGERVKWNGRVCSGERNERNVSPKCNEAIEATCTAGTKYEIVSFAFAPLKGGGVLSVSSVRMHIKQYCATPLLCASRRTCYLA
jgi:hypothetical protein